MWSKKIQKLIMWAGLIMLCIPSSAFAQSGTVENHFETIGPTVTDRVYEGAPSSGLERQDALLRIPHAVREITEKRTRNSKHYLMEDGSYQAVISMGDLHYQDENGRWQNINTALTDEADLGRTSVPLSKESAKEIRQLAQADPGLQRAHRSDRKNTNYRALQVPFDVRIPKDYSQGYSIGKGSDRLTFIPVGAAHAEGVVDAVYGDRVHYENVWSRTDVELAVTSEGVKETLILHDRSAPSTFSFYVNGELAKDLSSGNLNVLPAWLEDSNGVKQNLNYFIEKRNNVTTISLTIDTSGLQYPIKIDPTININTGIFETYVFEFNPSTAYGQYHFLYVGVSNSSFKRYRSFIKFDVSSLPESAQLISAEARYYLNSTYAYNNNCDIGVYKVLSNWNPNSLTWNTMPATQATYSSHIPVNGYPGNIYSFDILQLIKAWKDNPETNYGFMLKDINESDHTNYRYREFRSTIYGGGYSYITINYNLKSGNPTVSSPNGGETVDSNYMITWNAATDPDTTQSNLKYQIQLSTNGGGSWSNIVPLTPSGTTSYTYNFSPVAESTNSLVRIRAYDGYSYGPWDQSDAPFAIRHNHAPNAPGSLSPGNAASSPALIAGTTPTLHWTFSDPDAGDAQSAYHVQIYTSTGTSLVYDSGWVHSGASTLTVPAGKLARGAAYAWRVAVKDSQDAASPYSGWQYVRSNHLPSLALTSYTDGQTLPDNILTFAWNYSDGDGQAQTAFQVVGTQDLWATWGYNSGVVNGSDVSFTTPPLGSGNWHFAVRVFDGLEWSDWAGRSNLTLPNSFEPNDSSATAFPAAYNAVYSSFIGSSSDVDFYQYTAGATGLDQVTLAVPTGLNYDLIVYNADGMPLVAGVKPAGATEDNVYEVIAGHTYYVKVYAPTGDASTASTYTLQVVPYRIDVQTYYQFDGNGNLTGKQTAGQ